VSLAAEAAGLNHAGRAVTAINDLFALNLNGLFARCA
jgi:hypothetical protein